MSCTFIRQSFPTSAMCCRFIVQKSLLVVIHRLLLHVALSDISSFHLILIHPNLFTCGVGSVITNPRDITCSPTSSIRSSLFTCCLTSLSAWSLPYPRNIIHYSTSSTHSSLFTCCFTSLSGKSISYPQDTNRCSTSSIHSSLFTCLFPPVSNHFITRARAQLTLLHHICTGHRDSFSSSLLHCPH